MKYLKFCILTIITCLAIWGMSLAVMEGIERHERVVCLQLQQQADTYPARIFYITEEQDKMCKRIGLPVVAKVVK